MDKKFIKDAIESALLLINHGKISAAEFRLNEVLENLKREK